MKNFNFLLQLSSHKKIIRSVKKKVLDQKLFIFEAGTEVKLLSEISNKAKMMGFLMENILAFDSLSHIN